MDLTFQASEESQTVVQPDLFVMCGDFQHDKRVVGVPALIIEILSPSTAKHDLIRKLNVYLHDGSKLYWTEQEFKPFDTISPTMFLDLKISVSVIFGNPS